MWGQFPKRYLSHQSSKLAWKLLLYNFTQLSWGPMSWVKWIKNKYKKVTHSSRLVIRDSILHQLTIYVTRQIWGIWKLRPAYSPETPNLGQNRWCYVACDLEIWWMTLENNRASLLCCFKLCATFHSHWWIQTGVTVRKRPIWVKFDDF